METINGKSLRFYINHAWIFWKKTNEISRISRAAQIIYPVAAWFLLRLWNDEDDDYEEMTAVPPVLVKDADKRDTSESSQEAWDRLDKLLAKRPLHESGTRDGSWNSGLEDGGPWWH